MKEIDFILGMTRLTSLQIKTDLLLEYSFNIILYFYVYVYN